jgi:hypothetical protein
MLVRFGRVGMMVREGKGGKQLLEQDLWSPRLKHLSNIKQHPPFPFLHPLFASFLATHDPGLGGWG